VIENEIQYNLAKVQASHFEKTLTQIKALPKNKAPLASIDPLLYKAERDAQQSQLDSLREEIAEYEAYNTKEFRT
jgi:hypothetical protein